MSSIHYIKKVVEELGQLIRHTWTGIKSFEEVDDQYRSLRRRLQALEPIIGQPPTFIQASENLWFLWNSQVKNKLGTYQERREFLDEHYTKYYDAIISKRNIGTFEQEMMLRDLMVLRQIGEGGFGVVYEAEHVILQESRAVKKLEPLFALFANEEDEEKALRRFSREAQMLDRLSHPNIVRFFDAGMAGEHPFIIMEYVAGDNLQNVISNHGTLEVTVAIEIMRQLLNAVGAAHDTGVVHRDIKPTNLIWDGKRAVILDYGAGQWLEKQLSTRMTTTAVGTSGYIADELMQNPELISPSLDCFSLGVVFHYLLTGRLPNTEEPTYYLKEMAIEEEVQQIVTRAMAPATRRFADGAKMLGAIEALM